MKSLFESWRSYLNEEDKWDGEEIVGAMGYDPASAPVWITFAAEVLINPKEWEFPTLVLFNFVDETKLLEGDVVLLEPFDIIGAEHKTITFIKEANDELGLGIKELPKLQFAPSTILFSKNIPKLGDYSDIYSNAAIYPIIPLGQRSEEHICDSIWGMHSKYVDPYYAAKGNPKHNSQLDDHISDVVYRFVNEMVPYNDLKNYQSKIEKVFAYYDFILQYCERR